MQRRIDVELLDDERRLDRGLGAHVAQIREVQPQGPYALGGWSFGGLLAFDVPADPAAAHTLHDEIWDVVAFVEASATMTTQQYVALAEGPRAARHGHAREEEARPADAKAGRIAAERYLCATCHVIPGIVGADRHVGPPLSGMGRRATIGGLLPNTPENMVRWLKDPRAVDPRSTMPALHLTDQDARDIAAFLATLDDVNR